MDQLKLVLVLMYNRILNLLFLFLTFYSQGKYLPLELGSQFANLVKAYSSSEIIFSAEARVVVKNESSVKLKKCCIVLTNEGKIYITETNDAAGGTEFALRTPLILDISKIDKVTLSKMGDDFLVLGVPPPLVKRTETALDTSHWAPNSSSQSCFLCSDKFNIINRKHHCRACGKLVVSTRKC